MFTYCIFQTIFVDENRSGRLHGILHCINSMLNDLFELSRRQPSQNSISFSNHRGTLSINKLDLSYSVFVDCWYARNNRQKYFHE